MFNSGAARSTDPETSHKAAASIDATFLERLFVDAIKQLDNGGGGTCWEVMCMTGIAHQTLSPRQAPCRRKGLIRWRFDGNGKIIKRKSEGSNRLQIVWFYVPPEERAKAIQIAEQWDIDNDARRQSKSNGEAQV